MDVTALVQLGSSDMVWSCWKTHLSEQLRNRKARGSAWPSRKPGRSHPTALHVQTSDYTQEHLNTTITAAGWCRWQTSPSRLTAHWREEQAHTFNLPFHSFPAWKTSPDSFKNSFHNLNDEIFVFCEAEQVSAVMAGLERARGGILGGREWREKAQNRLREAKSWRETISSSWPWLECLGCEEKFQLISRHHRDQLVLARMAKRRVKTERKASWRERKVFLLTSRAPVGAAAFRVSSLPSRLCLRPSLLLPHLLFLLQSGGFFLFLKTVVNRPTSWC